MARASFHIVDQLSEWVTSAAEAQHRCTNEALRPKVS
jgi:hypothetical protein